MKPNHCADQLASKQQKLHELGRRQSISKRVIVRGRDNDIKNRIKLASFTLQVVLHGIFICK